MYAASIFAILIDFAFEFWYKPLTVTLYREWYQKYISVKICFCQKLLCGVFDALPSIWSNPSIFEDTTSWNSLSVVSLPDETVSPYEGREWHTVRGYVNCHVMSTRLFNLFQTKARLAMMGCRFNSIQKGELFVEALDNDQVDAEPIKILRDIQDGKSIGEIVKMCAKECPFCFEPVTRENVRFQLVFSS